MGRRAYWNLCTCVALAAHAVPAGAQDRDPATDPALNDPKVAERVRDLERPAGAALSPTPPPQRPLGEPRPQRAPQDPIQAALRAGPLRPEGTFISRQRGSLVRGRSGEWILVFRRDAKGRAERPMVIVPSRNVERMVAQAGPDPEARTFLVTGQVFAYRGVNYLLLPVVPPVLEDGDPPPAPTEPAEHPTPGTPPPASDPDLGEVIRELESHQGRTRELGSGPQPRSAAVGDHSADTPTDPKAETPAPALLPEGTMLLRRRGRLVRVAGGDTALLLDSDADTAAALDPPLILSPCAMLERMEWLALAQGEAMVFEVTGRVLEYRGRNHLLPMLFRAYPPTELERRQ